MPASVIRPVQIEKAAVFAKDPLLQCSYLADPTLVLIDVGEQQVGTGRRMADGLPSSKQEFYQMPKAWLITGTSRGLGRALAEAVLGAGDNLVATARDTNGLEDLSAQYGDQLILRPLDVTDFAAAEAAVDAAVKRFGRLDVVANVAGYGNLGPIEDTSIEDFRAQIDTNLFGPIHLSKAAIPIMRGQGSGHILNFSSVGGRIGSTGRAPYSAAKFGVEGFSEVMAT